ncbi:MAG: hypothetical protein WCT10_05145 [Patescibacteria group bacterium]
MTNHQSTSELSRAIERVESDLRAARQELHDKRDANKSQWDLYGSELCAEEMFKKESLICNKINSLEADLHLLRRYASGDLDLNQLTDDLLRLVEIETIREELAVEREQVDKRVGEIERLLRLLGRKV